MLAGPGRGARQSCAGGIAIRCGLVFQPSCRINAMRKTSKIHTLATLGLALPVIGAVQANQCAGIADDGRRLACYDQQFGVAPAAETGAAKASLGESGLAKLKVEVPAKTAHARSKMINDWDLAPDNGRNSFEIRSHKPVYLLIGTRTDNINEQPQSANRDNSIHSSIPGLSANEAQFQLGFKTRVLHNIFGDNGSLWAGYTQSSRWQVYSASISRPFRETNYEPEAMLMFRTPWALGNWNLRMSGITLTHQSNGRANPLSRSWNRVIAHFGIENDDLSIQLRPWMRIKEEAQDDNNPGIENYIGRGEIIVAKHFGGGHVLSLQARHSLRSGADSRGSIRLDWAIPISGNLNAHFSGFSGYGESLIDYNNRQSMLGVGVSLVDW